MHTWRIECVRIREQWKSYVQNIICRWWCSRCVNKNTTCNLCSRAPNLPQQSTTLINLHTLGMSPGSALFRHQMTRSSISLALQYLHSHLALLQFLLERFASILSERARSLAVLYVFSVSAHTYVRASFSLSSARLMVETGSASARTDFIQ